MAIGDTLSIVNIDGGITQHQLYDFDAQTYAPEAFEIAEALGENINELIDGLKDAANSSAKNAEVFIKEALQFKRALGVLEYDQPEFEQMDQKAADFGGIPVVTSVDMPAQPVAYTPIQDSATFTQGGNVSAPGILDVSISDPPKTAPGIAAPFAMDPFTVVGKNAPSLSYTLESIQEPAALDTAPVLDIDLNMVPVDTARFTTLDSSDIDSAISRLEANAAFKTFIVTPYAHLVPDVFNVVGQLLVGAHPDAQTVSDVTGLHTQRISNLWTKRGFSQIDALGTYAGVMHDKVQDRVARGELIQQEKWKHQAMLAGYDMGVVAYSLLIDILMAHYNIEFAALMAEAESQLEIARAGTAAYNARVSMYAAEAEVYNSQLATFNAALAEYKARMSVEDLKGRVNTTVSDAFSAGERAKSIEASKYSAAIQVEAAKLSIYEAGLRQLSLDVMKHEVDVESYKSDVLQWEAELQTAMNYYSMYSAQAKAFGAQMREQSASQSLTQVENKAVEAKAMSQAAQITVKAAQLTTAATSRASQYAADNARNETISAGYTHQLSTYISDLTARNVELKTRSPELSQLTVYNDASLRYLTQVMASVNRAAQVSQQSNIQLASAYAQLNETAGRAGASVEQGKLAGFRVSATIGASGGVSGSLGWSRGISNSVGKSVGDSESVTESLSA